MAGISIRQRPEVLTTLRVLVILEAVIFLVAAWQHLGYVIPLGFTTLAEPRIIPAAIVEGSIGLLFVVSAFALFAGEAWAWTATLAVHGYALVGTLLGITVLALGFGPRTSTNDLYHMVMLWLVAFGLAFMLPAGSRSAESLGAGFFHWLIRVTGLIQIYLGLLFWVIQNDALVPVHILMGSTLVVSLWILAILSLQAGVDQRFVALAIVWGLIVVILGLTQTRLLPGPAHWVIELLHLLVGLGAIGQGDGLAMRIRKIQGAAV